MFHSVYYYHAFILVLHMYDTMSAQTNEKTNKAIVILNVKIHVRYRLKIKIFKHRVITLFMMYSQYYTNYLSDEMRP